MGLLCNSIFIFSACPYFCKLLQLFTVESCGWTHCYMWDLPSRRGIVDALKWSVKQIWKLQLPWSKVNLVVVVATSCNPDWHLVTSHIKKVCLGIRGNPWEFRIQNDLHHSEVFLCIECRHRSLLGIFILITVFYSEMVTSLLTNIECCLCC